MELTLAPEVVSAVGRDVDLAMGRALLDQLDHERFAGLGPDHTERVIVRAIELCDAYALGMTQDLAYVLFVMVHLGARFDEDPRYRELTEVLTTIPEGDLDPRLPRARAAFVTIGDRYIGPEGRIRDAAAQQFLEVLPSLEDEAATLDDVRKALATLYPCGAEAVPLALVERAMTTARDLGLPSAFGDKLALVLLFWLGAGAATDPLYPWIRDLAPKPGEDPTVGARRIAAYARKRFVRRLSGASPHG